MWHLRGGQFIFSESPVRRDPLENFKALWSGEASAVNTYTHCAEVLKDPSVLQTVQFCLKLHAANEQKLRDYVVRLGDEVPHIDLWHTLANLKDALAGIIGDELSIAMLSKMEEDFLGEYMDAISAFENENLDFIQHQLIPNQERCFQSWKLYDQAQPDVLPPQSPFSEITKH